MDHHCDLRELEAESFQVAGFSLMVRLQVGFNDFEFLGEVVEFDLCDWVVTMASSL